MRGASQVLADCPHCKVESALIELIDSSERIGVAIEGSCRLCGYATEFGEVTVFGRPFFDEAEVIEALSAWARADGEPDVEQYALANFNGRRPAAIAALVLAGERVDTGFDVIAWLFPSLQGGRRDDDERLRVGDGGVPIEPRRAPPTAETGTEGPGGPGGPAPRAGRYGAAPRPTNEPSDTPFPPDPRDIARALATVMLADGKIRPSERRFLDAALERMGAPPLDETDLRLWRPSELGPVADPKAVLEAMRLLALCDREADGSERRVLEEYARAWRVPLGRDPLPRPGAMAELGRILRSLVLV